MLFEIEDIYELAAASSIDIDTLRWSCSVAEPQMEMQLLPVMYYYQLFN